MPKAIEHIYKDIQRRFEDMTQKRIQEGTVIDFYTIAVAEAIKEAYEEIENSKNPHIFTKLSGQDLDDTGFFVNLPRKPGEDDESYKYRLMNWVLSAEASNYTAIHDALLNMEYASNAEFIPLTNGSGTASVYIIPKEYDDEIIENAIKEAEAIIKEKASPSLYVEYIVPTIRPVSIHAYVESKEGDIYQIRSNIEEMFKNYVNSIPPKQYLMVGRLNQIGINEPQVDYFDILQVFVDGKETKKIEILQDIETKFILDEVIWS